MKNLEQINEESLLADGWIIKEKDVFTGKPTWYKEEYKDTMYNCTNYLFILTIEDKCKIGYYGGEFSIVIRVVETMQQVKDFVKVLSLNK